MSEKLKYYEHYTGSGEKPKPKMLSTEPLIHKGTSIKDSYVGHYTEIGENWKILESTFGHYSYAAGSDGVIHYCDVGNFCSIASHVVINPGDHPMHRVTQHHCTYRVRQYGFGDADREEFFDWRRGRRCTVGHDVWMGHSVKLMASVNVGTGCVIGAGSVVTKDIPPYSIAVGSPAKVIRKRFEDKLIDQMLEIAWWNWERSKLEQEFDLLYDVGEFIEKHG